MAVYASREAYSIRPLFNVVHKEAGGVGSIQLTVDEARELANKLLVLAGAVERS